MDDAWAQRGDDIEDADRLEERRLAYEAAKSHLAVAYAAELDKLSDRNFELRMENEGLKQQVQTEQENDEKDALTLLSRVFDAWENGTECHEGEYGGGTYIGTAFQLDDDVFHRCCNLLNRTNPPRNAPTREWVGLTAYEVQELHLANQHWGNFACAIEAKLKEKNT